jgi:hypothetical protein
VLDFENGRTAMAVVGAYSSALRTGLAKPKMEINEAPFPSFLSPFSLQVQTSSKSAKAPDLLPMLYASVNASTARTP